MTASSVTSPNASVNAPSSSVPSASSVSSPSSSDKPSSNASNVTPPTSSVKPVGSSTVKPLGIYDVFGNCADSTVNPSNPFYCKTARELKDEQTNLEIEAKFASGQRRLEIQATLLEIDLQKALREKFGNDKAGDTEFNNIVKSEMYKFDFDLANNAAARVSLLTNILDQVKSKSFTKSDVAGLRNFMGNYRVGVDDTGRPYFFFTGQKYGANFDSSTLATYEWSSGVGGVPTIYLNGNQGVFDTIFGSTAPGKIIGLLVASMNGLKSTRGGRERNPRVANTGGYNLASYKSESSRGFSNVVQQRNPCDVRLTPPTSSSTTRANVSFAQLRREFEAIERVNDPVQNQFAWLYFFRPAGEYDVLDRGNEDFRNFIYGYGAESFDLTFLQLLFLGEIASDYANRGAFRRLYPGFLGEDPADIFWERRGYEYGSANCGLK